MQSSSTGAERMSWLVQLQPLLQIRVSVQICQKFLLRVTSRQSLGESISQAVVAAASHFCALIIIIRMKVTMKHPQTKKVEPQQTKSSIRPTLFEMKHYPHDGIFQELAHMLIRPPRFAYNPEMLKPSRKLKERFIVETHYLPFELTLYRQEPMRYVILYLHGNGSSSFQGTLFLPPMPDGVGLACFDFNGCGNRVQGEYITLGQEECKQVDIAARFLKEKGYRIAGWGRSMGAVSLLMSSECDVMVSDSAYSDLPTLCKQSSSKFLPTACCCLFHCMFPCIFACISCKVESLAGLQISRMNICKHIKELPAHKQICFIHGEEDTLIPVHHAQKLYDAFQGRKMLIEFEGTHNSTRPNEVIQRCFEFIEEGLNLLPNMRVIRANTKLVQMVPVDRASSTSPVVSQPTTKPLQQNTDKQTRIDGYSLLHRQGRSNKVVKDEHSCVNGEMNPVPDNFCDVINNQMDIIPIEGLNKEGTGKKAHLGDSFFVRRCN